MSTGAPRIDSASRIILAPRRDIYATFDSGEALMEWRRPASMTARIHHFEARTGGTYRMSLIYGGDAASGQGKSAELEDSFTGRFAERVADRSIVELIEFETEDAAFSGTMKMTTRLEDVAGGTRVTITCEDVPPGIGQADHLDGLREALANLAALLERPT
jgi:uncharacterized protein YndB with AHSA1/START domain